MQRRILGVICLSAAVLFVAPSVCYANFVIYRPLDCMHVVEWIPVALIVSLVVTLLIEPVAARFYVDDEQWRAGVRKAVIFINLITNPWTVMALLILTKLVADAMYPPDVWFESAMFSSSELFVRDQILPPAVLLPLEVIVVWVEYRYLRWALRDVLPRKRVLRLSLVMNGASALAIPAVMFFGWSVDVVNRAAGGESYGSIMCVLSVLVCLVVVGLYFVWAGPRAEAGLRSMQDGSGASECDDWFWDDCSS